MPKYKAVLFDLDGTVLYTLEDIFRSTNRTLRHMGLPETDPDSLQKAVGNGARRQIAAFMPGGEDNPRFEEAISFYRTDYTAHCNDYAKPYPEIPELLAELKNWGIKMAIVSNKPQPATSLLWEAHFADTMALALGERAGIPRKPDPDMVLLALNELGVSKEEAVYVGDSEVDILTAQNAGIPCLSAGWGYRPIPFLEKAGATRIFSRPLELLQSISPGAAPHNLASGFSERF